MKDARYSIKDLENLSGIKAHTLRIWEKRYGILRPERTDTNIRFYSDSDLKKLLNVSLLNKHGYKISLLSTMNNKDLNNTVLSVTQNDSTTDNHLDILLAAMIELDEQKFEKIINNAIIHFGFEETVIRVIHPMFEKVGILWQTGSVNPAQEHFVSNLIRQKILVAIDGIIPVFNTEAKSFLLFLPEGEWHELGLLFYAYFIKKAGHKVIYLGQSLPFDSLIEASRSVDSDFLFTIMTCSLQDTNSEWYISKLSDQFSEKKIFVSGMQVKGLENKMPENVILIQKVAEFKSILVNF